MPQPLLLLIVAAVAILAVSAPAAPDGGGPPEAQHLLEFMRQFDDKRGVFRTWKAATDTCTWAGVMCRNAKVWGLKLENMELEGPVRLGPLKSLNNLITLSLMNNNFSGPIPEIGLLRGLKSVYLSHNRFNGVIPEHAFDDCHSLKKLHLAFNNFSGPIPGSLGKLPKLKELRLEENKFEGPIPDLPEVKIVNVSSNALTGQVPESLSKLSETSFTGNDALCGPPLPKPCSPPPETQTEATPPPKSKPTTALTIVVAVFATALALAAICTLTFIALRRRSPPLSTPPQQVEAPPAPSSTGKKAAGSQDPGMAAVGKKGEPGKLCFVSEDVGGGGGGRPRFELADLLRASAEMLGAGSLGSAYKAAVMSWPVLVVKRFRLMNGVNKEEFQEHMRRLGRLNHPNLLPLVAYYYRKEEKLLIANFVDNGSLAVRLHGNNSKGLPSLDWPTRLRIVKGVASGLSYLYKELPSFITPHGHLKSSNVLLTRSYDPILNDYALIPVTNPDQAHRLLVAYKSPEYRRLGRVTKKTDLWSLGILILEILTGEVPATFLEKPADSNAGTDDDSDLMRWVASIAALGESTEVFDKSMGRMCEGEMVKLLKIGMSCCEEDVEKRWDVREAMERIEELRETS